MEKYAPKIKLLAGKLALPQINKSDFSNIKLTFPSLSEQQKIADFLTQIDQKIEKTEGQIAGAEVFKKGLLQGMFV